MKPMKISMLLLTLLMCVITISAQSFPSYAETERQMLSGTDKDHMVNWDFFCTGGANSGHWTTIGVPSCWELQGFGTYNYGHDKPHSTEQGLYRKHFTVSRSWKNRNVFIVFEGSMTDTEVKVNGKLAGPVHQGAFFQFRYDITPLISFGKDNVLEVKVSKESSNESINRAERQADYWIFGGIFRPVYLEAVPKNFISRVAIDARADGDFKVQVFSDSRSYTSAEVTITDAAGGNAPLARFTTLRRDSMTELQGKVPDVVAWSSETPHLYTANVVLKKGGKVLHTYRQRFGFRTIEFRRGDGLYLNGSRVMFKGVCRHTFWPESGRTSSKALAISDVMEMKDMNMNAVRMSHYPPDSYFLDVCDSLGLLVIDELPGWQKKYDTPTARRLVGEMIRHDVNHPSIVLWANGNEGGFNTEVRGDYALWDPQNRHIVEPWSKYDGFDNHHYPKYDQVKNALEKGNNIFFPTEMLHGLYDGGHGAGLDDYWSIMKNSRLAAGGFLWNLADEGVVRHDKRDSIDTDKLHAGDGIVGPHHEREGSYYTIKEIWSPVQFPDVLPFDFSGTMTVRNESMFTPLDKFKFTYELRRYDNPFVVSVTQKGTAASPRTAPGHTGQLSLDLPNNWRSYDVLRVTVNDAAGHEVVSRTWNLQGPAALAARMKVADMKGKTITDSILDGLRFTGLKQPGSMTLSRLADGWYRLDYSYELDGSYDYAGITFSWPEKEVRGARLLANGPYHVWKNRLKGVTFGLYDKEYNNTVTGQDYVYPEFKGYYSNFYGLQLKTSGRPLTIIAATPGLYLRLFTPKLPVYRSENCEAPFPDGDISVLNCIPAMGSKFSRANQTGPQGQRSTFSHQQFHGTLYIHL